MLEGFVLQPVKALMITAGSVRCCLTFVTSICLYAMTEQPLIPWEAFCLLVMCFSHSCVQTHTLLRIHPCCHSFSTPLPVPTLGAVFLSNHQVIAFSCFLSESPQFLWMCWNLCPGQADYAVVCAFWWSLETSGFTEEIQTGMPLNAQMDWN